MAWDEDYPTEEAQAPAQPTGDLASASNAALQYDAALGIPKGKPSAKPASWEEEHAEAPITSDEQRSVEAGTVIRGTPVVGAYVPNIEAAAQAFAHPYTGVGHPGDTWDERYQKNLVDAKARYANFDHEHPTASTALQMGGGVLTTLPVGMTSIGAKVLGLGGKTLPQIAVRSSASSAAISAADAAARGEDPLSAAETGAELGAGLPFVTAGAGKLIRGIRALRPVPTEPNPKNFITVGKEEIPMAGPEMTGSRPGAEYMEEAAQGVHGEKSQQVMRDFINNEQKPAVQRAGTSIQTMMDSNGTVHAMSSDETGQIIGDAIRDKAAASKQNYDKLYEQFRQTQGQFAPFQNLGATIQGGIRPDWQAALSTRPGEPPLAPHAVNAINYLNNVGSRPLTTQEVDVVGKTLRNFSQGAQRNRTDAALMSQITHGFNDAIDGAMSSGRFQGDPNAISAWRNAKSAFAQHQQQFGGDDAAGHLISRILDPTQPPSHSQVANAIFGSNSGAPKATGASQNIIERLRNVLGQNSPEFASIGQGAFGRMTNDAGPQKIQTALKNYLADPASKQIHGHMPDVLPAMEQYRDVMSRLTPEFGVVNTSHSGNVIARAVVQPIKQHMLAAIGAGLGHMGAGLPGAIVTGALGEIIDRAIGGVPQRLAARETKRVIYGRPGETHWRQAPAQAGALVAAGAAPTIGEQERKEKTQAIARRQAALRSAAQR